MFSFYENNDNRLTFLFRQSTDSRTFIITYCMRHNDFQVPIRY